MPYFLVPSKLNLHRKRVFHYRKCLVVLWISGVTLLGSMFIWIHIWIPSRSSHQLIEPNSTVELHPVRVKWLNSPYHNIYQPDKAASYFQVHDVSCSTLNQENNDNNKKKEIDKAISKSQPLHQCPPDSAYIRQWTPATCSDYLRQQHFPVNFVAHDEELDFPLAYSIIAFKDACQVERLLRAIYRSHNIYCIHVDQRSNATLEALRSLSTCFDNVFVSEEIIVVDWGKISVLQVEISCMRQLFHRNKSWRYFINLTGQEFPLRTNWEMVQILRRLQGTNSVEAMNSPLKVVPDNRFPPIKPFPNMLYYKGSVHVALQRDAVRYVLEDHRAKSFYKLLEDHKNHCPEETFFATINHNVEFEFPGGHPPTSPNVPMETRRSEYPFIVRLKSWLNRSHWDFFECRSRKEVHWLCIWGVEDLPLLTHEPEMFVNKVYWNFQPRTLDCLEQWLWTRTLEQWRNQTISPLDWKYYLKIVPFNNNTEKKSYQSK